MERHISESKVYLHFSSFFHLSVTFNAADHSSFTKSAPQNLRQYFSWLFFLVSKALCFLFSVWEEQDIERYFAVALSLSCVQLFATPWIVADQDVLSMGFPRQAYWSGLPFPSSGKLPNPVTEPTSPALADRFCTTASSGKPYRGIYYALNGKISCLTSWMLWCKILGFLPKASYFIFLSLNILTLKMRARTWEFGSGMYTPYLIYMFSSEIL